MNLEGSNETGDMMKREIRQNFTHQSDLFAMSAGDFADATALQLFLERKVLGVKRTSYGSSNSCRSTAGLERC